MQVKEILKLVGAGVTGALVALKIRGPRQSYNEFLQIYAAISIEFRHQFETVFLQTMLPAVGADDRDDLCLLLDRESTFQEQLRFFQARVDGFDELVVRAFERLYRLRAEGSIAPTTRRRMLPDFDAFRLGLNEVFLDLERSFLGAVQIHLPETVAPSEAEPSGSFPEFLREVQATLPSFASCFFDGLARFEETLATPAVHGRMASLRS
ncbi:MAG: hypothetical protein WAO20_17580 [Acidobacteriota bacterium]